MKHIEEILLLISSFWMLIYFHGLWNTGSAAYSHVLLIFPIILLVICYVIYYSKVNKD
ncbi:hypothetical protein GCM10007358_00650 [Phocicoccus schoeneichii]|nr:hypothetical protein GCM10007358_00650 [Jeotgalicoccus schoeneichii]